MTPDPAVPPLPRFHVARPALLDLLDQGAQVPVTVVIGPPGTGKSVLLAEWARDRRPDAVWLTCDPSDREPTVFASDLVTALRRWRPGCFADASDLLAERSVDARAVVDSITAELATLEQPPVVVLDDAHLLADVATLLLRAVDRLPPGARLLVASRTEPPIALHRLRAEGRVHEIRQVDLRMTPGDVERLLEDMGANRGGRAVEVLTERTDGWAAGVQMAALSLRDEADPDAFLAEFSGTSRVVGDFLLAEVLERQPAEVRDFLVQSSVLDVLEPGACDAVTGSAGSARRLRALHAAGLLMIPTGARNTYRYHQLFRDLLRFELRAESPEREREAHRRAAAWYVQQGPVDRALAHLVAAGDAAGARELLRARVTDEFLRGGSVTVVRMVAAIAPDDHTEDPALLVALAVALGVAGSADEADVWIERARRRHEHLDPLDRDHLAMAEGFVTQVRGDSHGSEAALARVTRAVPDDPVVVAHPAVALRSRLWLGDVAGARVLAERALTGPTLGTFYEEVTVGGALSWVACVEGALGEAAHLARRAIDTALHTGGDHHPGAAEPWRTLGRISFEHGDLAEAEPMLERSIRIAERTRPAFAYLSGLSLARLWLAQGRGGDAREALATARALLPAGSDSPLLGLGAALEARLALTCGDTRGAAEAAARVAPGHRPLVLARVELANAAPARARALLESADPRTRREQLDTTILAARTAHELGLAEADALLSRCVELAEPEGFAFALVDDDLAPLASRLGVMLRATASGPFGEQLLALLDNALPRGGVLNPTAALVEPLSERELTVLRYLGSRHTTAEIAGELYISVNTLKTHTKAVYRKLGVSSRREAVEQARVLGLR